MNEVHDYINCPVINIIIKWRPQQRIQQTNKKIHFHRKMMKNLKRRLMMMETIFGNLEITEESRFTNTREKCLLMFDNITKKMEKGCQEKKGSHFRGMYGKIWNYYLMTLIVLWLKKKESQKRELKNHDSSILIWW